MAVALAVAAAGPGCKADGLLQLKFDVELLACCSVIGTICICGGLDFRAPSAAEDACGSDKFRSVFLSLALDVVDEESRRDDCFFAEEGNAFVGEEGAIELLSTLHTCPGAGLKPEARLGQL